MFFYISSICATDFNITLCHRWSACGQAPLDNQRTEKRSGNKKFEVQIPPLPSPHILLSPRTCFQIWENCTIFAQLPVKKSALVTSTHFTKKIKGNSLLILIVSNLFKFSLPEVLCFRCLILFERNCGERDPVKRLLACPPKRQKQRTGMSKYGKSRSL